MTKENTIAIRLAHLVSTLGHPLLTLAVFTLLISFQLYDVSKALLISVLIIGLVVIPVTIRNYIKVKNKTYTNFDVSDRKQRQSFYGFALTVLGIATLMLYLIPGTQNFLIGTLCALFMTIVSAVVNFKIKTSLHTSVMLFVAIVQFNLNVALALILCTFTFFIALSRLKLQRHTLTEVITGACIGFFSGVINNYLQQL